jgi:hypothetical protein
MPKPNNWKEYDEMVGEYGFFGLPFKKYCEIYYKKNMLYKIKLRMFFLLSSIKIEWISDLRYTLKYFNEVWEKEWTV